MSCVLSCMVAAEPLPAPAVEGAGQDRRARELPDPDQESHVVERHQPESEHLSRHEQVAEISPREPGAGGAIAGVIQRLVRGTVLYLTDVHSADRGARAAVASVAGRGCAIEKVLSPGDSLDQISRKPDTHKMTGPVGGERVREILEYPVHHRFGLPHRESPDGDAGPGTAFQGSLERAHPEVGVGPSLDDGPQSLGRYGCRAAGR